MKRSAIAASAALMVVLLAGCSAPTASEGPSPSAPSTAPLVAESPVPAPSAETADTAYVSAIRTATEANDDSQVASASDEQFIQAGRDACEQIADGTDVFDVRVVEGEEPTAIGYEDSLRISGAALEHLCPEFQQG